MKKPSENKAPLSPTATSPHLYPENTGAGEQQMGGEDNVLIRMKPGRAIDGVGPGESAVVDRQLADHLIKIGYATEEEEHDNQ